MLDRRTCNHTLHEIDLLGACSKSIIIPHSFIQTPFREVFSLRKDLGNEPDLVHKIIIKHVHQTDQESIPDSLHQ